MTPQLMPRAPAQKSRFGSKNTPQMRAVICKLVRLGLSVNRAAGKVKVHHKTIGEWRSADPDFDADIKEAEAQFIQRQVETIEAAANKGSWQAAAWLLERKHVLEFSQPQIQLLQNNSMKVEFKDLGALMEEVRESPEAMRALAAMGESIEVFATVEPVEEKGGQNQPTLHSGTVREAGSSQIESLMNAGTSLRADNSSEAP